MVQTSAFQQAIQDLADRQRSDLEQGRCAVIQSGDRRQGYILIDAEGERVWDVITDYESFPAFLPTVVGARIVVDEGDRKVVEQVDERQVLFAKVTSQIQTENVEVPPRQIKFQMTEGDLKQFEGSWQVIAASTESAQPTLLLQTVEAEAGAGPLEMAFDQILKRSLKDNLEAIAQEVYRRREL
ncbi:MAG: SRPBCC family protein [Elainellaceae cyanobacterium]